MPIIKSNKIDSKKLIGGILSILTIFIVVLNLQTAKAAAFTQVSILLNNQHSQSQISGTVCAKPSNSGGIENQISIDFPNDFTISNLSSNWATNTNNLPSGAIPWPSISLFATNVTQKTVTFSSGDLASNLNMYCFNFIGNSSLTGSVGAKNGFITTKNITNTIIDRQNYGLTIKNNNQITITGAIAEKSTDFQMDFTSSNQGGILKPGDEVEYTISYESNLEYPYSFTVETDWSMGTIQGLGMSSFDILNYVPGSASKGYNGATPIIDLVHRKIIWNIVSLPTQSKNNTVSFKLVTVPTNATNQNIDAVISAKLYTNSISLPKKDITIAYFAPAAIVPTPTSIPEIQPTTIPAIGVTSTSPTTTMSISEKPEALKITSFEITELQDTSASFSIKTNQVTTANLYYGTSLHFEKNITAFTLNDEKIITLNDLIPNTTYYLKLEVKNEKGEIVTSPEVFTFTTASKSSLSSLDQNNVIILANSTILKSRVSTENNLPILFPTSKGLDIVLPFTDNPPLQVFLKIINSQVLGINSQNPPLYIEKIRLLETKPGIFSGRINTPSAPGLYDLILETQMIDGSNTITTLSKFRITKPLQIYSQTGLPIENARVTIEVFDPKLKTFGLFPAETMGFKNPSYSDADGTVDLILPEGRYKIQVMNIKYQTKEIIFDFSPTTSVNYPKIILTESPFSIKNNLIYYLEIASDSFDLFKNNVDRLAVSDRFLQLSFLLGLFIFSVLSLMLTIHHLKIKFEDLFVYLQKYWRIITRQKILPENLLSIFIEYKNGFPIHGAAAILISAGDRKNIYKNITNVLGELQFPIDKNKEYELVITKKNFETFNLKINDTNIEKNCQLYQMEEKKVSSKSAITEFLIIIGKIIFRISSDTFMVMIVIFHLFYIELFGITRDLPMILITTINITLYFELLWKDFKMASIKK